MASIADAIALNAGANNQYALAGAYLDALAVYISFLTNEMGYSSEKAVQFVMDKYVLPLAGGKNGDVVAYVEARLGDQPPVPVDDDVPAIPGSENTLMDVLRTRGVL
jgi:hypothetical protein